jgi:hypothetical protein
MSSRYDGVPLFINNYPIYRDLLEDRGVRFVRQHVTPTFKPLTPTQEASVSVEIVTWEMGSRLEKLAAEHYNAPTAWWVIARYNQKPTDSHFQLGDKVYIPKPLGVIMSYYLES